MLVSFWEKLTINQKLAITAWTFLFIPIIFYVVIRFYPTFEAFYVSTLKWNLLGAKKYIGFKNYERILGDEDFWLVLLNTIKYAIFGVPIINAYGMTETTGGGTWAHPFDYEPRSTGGPVEVELKLKSV